MENPLISAHCRGHFYREFAWKTVEGTDKPNPAGVLLDLIRARIDPIRNAAHLIAKTIHYDSKPGKYVSVYSFSRLVQKGDLKGNGQPYPDYLIGKAINYESAKLNRIYLDFDNKDNPQKAIDEAILVIRSLNRHKIYTHQYFSGKKGIALYIEFITVDIKPENKKEVLRLFLDTIVKTVKDDFGYDMYEIVDGEKRWKNIDYKVSFDLARVSRIPNTTHKSGLYCIPVTVAEMRRGLEYIMKLATNPSCVDLDIIITTCMRRNSKLPRIMLNLEKEVIKEREYQLAEKKKKELYWSQVRPRIEGVVTEDQIQRARNAPLSKVIGNDIRMRCPIHHGHNPTSFYVDHQKNYWYCHSCQRGGNAITFLMEKEKKTFKDAVLALQ